MTWEFHREDYPKLKWEPTEDQRTAVHVLCERPRYILADVTGLGKTYAVLSSYAVLKKAFPEIHLMVMVTPSAIVSWKGDLAKGTDFSYVDFTVANPGYDELTAMHDVSLVTYSALEHGHFHKYVVGAFNYRPILLVCDEAHELKNPKAYLNQVFSRLGPHAKYWWLLTATPLTNHLEDLYNIVSLVCPGFLGELWEFLENYTIRDTKFIRLKWRKGPRGQKLKPKGYGVVLKRDRKGKMVPYRKIKKVVGRKNLSQLNHRLKPILLRRDHDLNISFFRETVTLKPEEMDLYLIAAAGCLGGTQKDFAARCPDLQLAVNNTVRADRSFNDNYDTLSTKEVKWLSLVEETLRRKEAVVSFSSSLPTKERLSHFAEELCEIGDANRFFEIDGSVSTKKRNEIVEAFGPGDILLISKAGGQSLNLQVSRTIIFYDLPFDLKVFVQAVGRVARMNTKFDEIKVYILEALGTIDTYKSYMIFNNSDTFKQVLSGGSTLPPSVVEVTRKMLIELRKDLLWQVRRRAGK